MSVSNHDDGLPSQKPGPTAEPPQTPPHRFRNPYARITPDIAHKSLSDTTQKHYKNKQPWSSPRTINNPTTTQPPPTDEFDTPDMRNFWNALFGQKGPPPPPAWRHRITLAEYRLLLGALPANILHLLNEPDMRNLLANLIRERQPEAPPDPQPNRQVRNPQPPFTLGSSFPNCFIWPRPITTSAEDDTSELRRHLGCNHAPPRARLSQIPQRAILQAIAALNGTNRDFTTVKGLPCPRYTAYHRVTHPTPFTGLDALLPPGWNLHQLNGTTLQGLLNPVCGDNYTETYPRAMKQEYKVPDCNAEAFHFPIILELGANGHPNDNPKGASDAEKGTWVARTGFCVINHATNTLMVPDDRTKHWSITRRGNNTICPAELCDNTWFKLGAALLGNSNLPPQHFNPTITKQLGSKIFPIRGRGQPTQGTDRKNLHLLRAYAIYRDEHTTAARAAEPT